MNVKKDFIEQIKKRIKELIPKSKIDIYREPVLGLFRPDFMAEIVYEKIRFKIVGEILENESSAVFHRSISQLQSYVRQNPELVPLLISKYFSPKRREECKSENIYYLDFSGNAYVSFKSIYIERVGFSNKFPEPRKGRNPFSDKSSLIIRLMLNKKKNWGVRELAEEAGLDAGYVSRMVRELENLNYIAKKNGKSVLIDPKSIIEDWVLYYDHKKNEVNNFFCLAQGPEEILNILRKLEIPESENYALAYHAGAYLVSPHAIFNEVHIYVSEKKSLNFFIQQLKLKPVERGANVILLYPYYKHSAFYGKRNIQGLWVVSDIQLYLDLYKYPPRGLEQAEHLYEKHLKKMIEGIQYVDDR